MRLKLVACEVLLRECCHLIAQSPNAVDPVFLSKGLHDLGAAGMQKHIAETLAQIDESAYDAVLLGYALCSGGVAGLATRMIPLVIPRAHDCITLLLGDRQRYRREFDANPGTYFHSTGWVERGDPAAPSAATTAGIAAGGAAKQLFDRESLIAKYGDDNAQYIIAQLTGMTHYSRVAFIATGLEPSAAAEATSQRCAAERGWHYERLEGNLTLLKRLIDGEWGNDSNNDFFVLRGGEQMTFRYDEIDTGE